MGKRSNRPIACVLGEIDLVQALALAGVRSAVTAAHGEPVRYSHHVAAVLERIDPWRRPDAAVEGLVAFARSQPAPPPLFYDADWDLLLVSRLRERLREHFRFVVPDSELVEDLVDKARFQELSERLALPVPRAARLAGEVDPSLDLGLRFPVVVKPLTRHHDVWRPLARGKALALADDAALRSLWEQLAETATDVLVQEMVPGPETKIESYHVYVDAEGVVAGEFTGRKLRTWPRQFGYSTALEITASDEVRELGRDLVTRLRLQGVAKFDFKRDQDGELKLLEVNPRFNLWHHPGAIAGVNIPALVYADLTGRPRPPTRTARAGVRWCSFAHDARAARADGIGALRWLRWALSCEAKSGFSWRDPLPLPRALASRLIGARRGDGAGATPHPPDDAGRVGG